MRTREPAAIWRQVPADLKSRLERCLATSLAGASAPVAVFFRADDIAVPGRNFQRLMEIFRTRRVPLNLALVPAWLSGERWRVLLRLSGDDPRRWCWHQHGWRHANHEREGKKQEFGPARPLPELNEDLLRGRRRLEQIVGADFYPVFTPPWNRCDERTLACLMTAGYRAVSRSAGSRPPVPPRMPDLAVNVDFHTRREQDPVAGWSNLLREVENALKSGRCGVMIHHQLMNQAAFDFLDFFLGLVGRLDPLRPVDFRNLSP